MGSATFQMTVFHPGTNAAYVGYEVEITNVRNFTDGGESYPGGASETLTADAAGFATTTLGTPDNGSALYEIKFVTSGGGRLAFYVADGETITLEEIIAASGAAAGAVDTLTTLLSNYLPLAGDTMTGQLDFSGTDHAGVVVISLTTAQRDALTPAVGMIIYNSTTAQFEKYDGAWGALGGAAPVDSVFGRTGAVVAATSDYDAIQVDVTPAGGIASTDVQAALVELDGDIQSVAGSIPFDFTALNDTPASISANTLMWGGPLGSALVEKTAGDSLTTLGAAASGHNHDTSYADLRPAENEQTGTTYTLVLTDEDKIIQTTSASAVTVTVPPNSSVAFPTGSVIGFEQYGAGTLSCAAGAGVTIRSLNGSLSMSGQYGSAALRKIGADEWLLVGALA